MLSDERNPIIPSHRRIGEVFEELATEIADELLLENFIDLNPEIENLGNTNPENSDFKRRKRMENS